MTPPEERELLLRVVTKLAQTLLQADTGFIPFGAVLGVKRDVQILMPKSMKQNATVQELNAYWARELGKAVAASGSKTVCMCSDVRVPTEHGNMRMAVMVHVEQISETAVDVLVPYERCGSSKISFRKAQTSPAERHIFKMN